MTKNQWKQIFAAKELLGLEDRATYGEMKKAYRRMCKIHHPDTTNGGESGDNEIISQITQAYDILETHYKEYRIPLVPTSVDYIDPEDWWLDRFGQDPLWGKKKR